MPIIVVATGARRERPTVPGAALPHVLTGDDLRAMLTGERIAAGAPTGGTDETGSPTMAGVRSGLRLPARVALAVGARTGLTDLGDLVRSASRVWMPIGERVVILGGGLVGVELADFMAERGRGVTVLEPGPVVGVGMAHPRRWRAVHEARLHGVTFVTNAELVDITTTDVGYRTPAADGAGDIADVRVAADTVIVAGGVHPDPTLADRLRSDPSISAEIHVVGDAGDVGYIAGAIRTAHDLALTL